MPLTSDVAVLGAGIVGLSTAYSLARQGLSVTIYESGTPGLGQSAGQSRIFRHAHDDPRLVELAVRARDQWYALSEALGTPLISSEGAVALGPAVPGRMDLLRSAGVEVHPLDADDLRTVLPIMAGYDGDAMLDVRGGSIDTRAAIAGLVQMFDRSIVAAEQVIALDPGSDAVTVRTPTTAGAHATAVICAGRGTASLARGVGVALPVSLGAHVRVSFRVREGVTRVPTLQDGSGHFGATGAYAAVYPDRSMYGLGMADDVDAHDDGTIDDARRLARLADAAAEYVRVALPGLDPTPRDVVHCWVTRLPWGDDGMAIWRSGPVVAVAGHNLFKHAPVIGEAVATTVISGQVAAGFAASDRLGEATI